VAYQPLWVFYRSPTPIALLSELAGKRIDIGEKGTATNGLATTLLQLNGIRGAPTMLVEQGADEAAAALAKGELDALFLMGEAASVQTLRTLLRAPNVQLYHFTQADAYVRRFPYLNKIVLPQGAIDFGQNLPAQDVELIGPTVELLVRKEFNGALSNIVLDTARAVHGRAGLLARRNEFPAPLPREYPISEDAQRYYKSGLGFTYQLVGSFWFAEPHQPRRGRDRAAGFVNHSGDPAFSDCLSLERATPDLSSLPPAAATGERDGAADYRGTRAGVADPAGGD